MFIIVSQHYVVHGIRQSFNLSSASIWLDGGQFNKMLTSLFIPGGTIGVGIFFILTGYFMYQSSSYNIKRLLKLLSQVYFYALLLDIVFLVLKFSNIYCFPEFPTNQWVFTIINSFIPVTSGSSGWFTQTYFLLFLFIPVLNKELEKLNKTFSFVIVLVLCWGCWYIPLIFGFTYSKLQRAIFFYILGAFIKKTDICVKKWISFIMFWLLWFSFAYIDYKSVSLNISSHKSLNYIVQLVETAFIIPLAVFFAFSFFKNIELKSSKIINKIASTTFGIYLVHDSAFGRPLLWNFIFHVLDIQYDSFYFPLFAFLTILFVFISISILDLMRQWFIEKYWLTFINYRIRIYNEKKSQETN